MLHIVTDHLSYPQMIILALIVKKVQIKALVKDKRLTMEAFGTYVEVVALQKPFVSLILASCTSVPKIL